MRKTHTTCYILGCFFIELVVVKVENSPLMFLGELKEIPPG